MGSLSAAPPGELQPRAGGGADEPESLFERFAWPYAFCREHLFRDDTACIADALWRGRRPRAGSVLLELGCGPGFYARRLARRYAELEVLGIDSSERQLERARDLAAAGGLPNLRFERADARTLAHIHGTADAVLSSRLLTVVAEPEAAIAEMYRVLLPGGRCFLAEPRSPLRAALPLRALWLLARIAALRDGPATYREPARPAVLSPLAFAALLDAQPWRTVRTWSDARYQYAVCEKAGGEGRAAARPVPW